MSEGPSLVNALAPRLCQNGKTLLLPGESESARGKRNDDWGKSDRSTLVLLFDVGVALAQTQQRVALVIGNGNYLTIQS